MSYVDKSIARDVNKSPIPQYYNDQTDNYEPSTGANGAFNVNQVGGKTLKGAVQNVTTAGTRVQLPDYPCREVTVIAKRGNTGSIFIGGNNVSSTVYGVELQQRDSFTFNVSNTNLLYIDSSVNGEGISYIAI